MNDKHKMPNGGSQRRHHLHLQVDADGFQIGHKMVLFQWQDGKKATVWPEELAPGRAPCPTPPWSQRS